MIPSSPIVLLLLALVPGVPDPVEGRVTGWTTHALEKVRPSDAPPDALEKAGPVEVSAARNEFEPFQLVLRSEKGEIGGVDVHLTDLVSTDDGHRISSRHATIYRVDFVDLHTRSSIEGATGPWPDPLLPRVDAYVGERRSAFPFTLSPRTSQPIWIDTYVPPGTPPGSYRGEVRVEVRGEPALTFPLTLTVWPFDLPSTSSLPTSYGLSGPWLMGQHYGRYTSDEDLLELSRLYTAAALRHRVSVHGASMIPPDATFRNGEASLDWARYDGELAPFLDGTAFDGDQPLPGARLTSVDMRTPPHLSGEERELYWRAWTEHFRDRGWLDRLFLYLWDEPQGPDDYPEVLRHGWSARRAAPDLPVLLTEQLTPDLSEVVDVWVTLVNCIETRPGVEADCEATVPRAAYEDAEDRGSRLWWYQSCASHGCNTVGGAPYTRWPSYVIDAPPAAHRIMPWLAWTFDVGGELYYNTVEAYGRLDDPWSDVYLHGGNGDGTLFYPGTPDRIGGDRHVPIESLRLKLIREGLEDYEYLRLLSRSGPEGAAMASSWARRIAPHTYEWQRSPEALYAARQAIARHLARKEPTR